METQTKKAAWLVILPGYRPFSMVGEPMTQAEALECARVIWPNADVE